jgi:polygalacturonase
MLAGCTAAPANAGAMQSNYNVRNFGAIGNGTHLDSPAINRAIAACNAHGGGTVEVPAGTYLCGSIHLMSHINFHLAPGATILGAPIIMGAYDPAEPFAGRAYQDGGHTYFHNSLIWGENLRDVAITGMGTINGGGVTTDAHNWARHHRAAMARHIGVADKAIALKLCTNVLIRDVTIIHGGHFGILVTGCDLLTLNNITIDTDRDGVDIDCCRNTCVSNCRINSPHDDGLCLKATDALHELRPTENVTITNCQLSGFKEGTLLNGKMLPSRRENGRIKLGTESDGGFKNITISNCTFRDCMGLAIEEVDGAMLEDINVSNITMRNVKDCPIYITLGDRDRAPPPVAVGHLRHILISNIIATNSGSMSGIQITGLPHHDVRDIRLDNIRLIFNGGGTRKDARRNPPELNHGYPGPTHIGVMPSYGVFVRHARNIELSNIKVSYRKTDQRPAMICKDVHGLQINDFEAELAKGVTPAHFINVTRLQIRHSPVLKSSGQ